MLSYIKDLQVSFRPPSRYMIASIKSSSSRRACVRVASRINCFSKSAQVLSFQQQLGRRNLSSSTDNINLSNDPTLPKGKWIRVKVDRTDLINIGPGSGNHNGTEPEPIVSHHVKEPLTNLAKDLQSYIFMRGPITLHDFIRQAANHAVHGYYQNKKESKIGEKGDFITAPEISHLFGEMITIWCVLAWKNLGSPESIRLVELGPGNGTLMQDMLKAASSFPDFKKALSIQMVELSDTMIQLQKEKLGCHTPTIYYKSDVTTYQTRDGISIQWYSHIKDLPTEKQTPCLFIGQEFLDTFPVHQLVRNGPSWREKLVECDSSDQSPYHFRAVLAPSETPAVLITARYEPWLQLQKERASNQTKHEDSTLILPPGLPAENKSVKNKSKSARFMDAIEVAPLALASCEQVASILKQCRGAALFIDYGADHTQEDSLRGFKGHKQVSVLSEPGTVDVTADVDFFCAARVLEAQGMSVLPLLTQRDFLLNMGLIPRVEALLEKDTTSEEQAELVVAQCKQLLGEDFMGTRFKVLVCSYPALDMSSVSSRMS